MSFYYNNGFGLKKQIVYNNNNLKKQIMDSINKSLQKYNNKDKNKDKINELINYYVNPINTNEKFLFYNFLASGLLCFIIGYKIGKGFRIK
jgi:hypothetical protein